ncbi:MAG: hypothetical protein RLZZ293_327 [Pseudomonadota bacterium]|jgi:BirA family biotin operon repressor/biotin-[acetyl-CoA-carboxylase] ligase
MEIKLLKQLTTNQGLSLHQLSKKLNLNPIEVLSLIGRIKQIQPNLIKQNNAHYQLNYNPDWLNANLLSELLANYQLKQYSLKLLEQINSTNSYALNNLSNLADKTIISCEWQFAGRGRFGRSWLSNIAQDLTITIIYHLPLEFNLTILPLLVAIAVNRLLKDYQISNRIKWPNDIYHQRQKIAGILVENNLRHQTNYTIIGIGLDNILNVPRNLLLIQLIQHLDNLLHEYNICGFAHLRQEWLDNCYHLHQSVNILHQNKLLASGIHTDIDTNGALLIKNSSGIHSYSSSTISLELQNGL